VSTKNKVTLFACSLRWMMEENQKYIAVKRILENLESQLRIAEENRKQVKSEQEKK
jgi:hypothetical protein